MYVELTNVCGLSCSFCPPKELPQEVMDLPFFDKILKQAKSYTKEIACHVMGDPLTLPNLHLYLDAIHRHGLVAMLTTSGYFLKKQSYDTLFHPCVKQINISLNSFNKNDTALGFGQYIEPVLALCDAKVQRHEQGFINLRVWNLDELMSELVFNQMVFESLSSHFGISLDVEEIYLKRPKSIRLAPKVLLHFDDYFEWPSLDNQHYGDGRCQGLQSHIAVLASGKVVPCCLDGDGIIELGNLHHHRLEEILSLQRTQSIIEGFQAGKAVEELCQKCAYKERFNKPPNC